MWLTVIASATFCQVSRLVIKQIWRVLFQDYTGWGCSGLASILVFLFLRQKILYAYNTYLKSPSTYNPPGIAFLWICAFVLAGHSVWLATNTWNCSFPLGLDCECLWVVILYRPRHCILYITAYITYIITAWNEREWINERMNELVLC